MVSLLHMTGVIDAMIDQCNNATGEVNAEDLKKFLVEYQKADGGTQASIKGFIDRRIREWLECGSLAKTRASNQIRLGIIDTEEDQR